MLRYYISPVVGAGTRANPYRLSIADLVAVGAINGTAAYWWQTDAASHPTSAWGLAVVRASSFASIDADASFDDLFGGNVPAQIDSAAAMIAYLQANTVASVPAARRTAINAVLDKYTVDRSDFTGQTRLWDVLYRVFQTIFGFQGDMTPVLAGFFV